MLLEGMTGRQARFNKIRKMEDMYNGVPGSALKGRSNITFDGVVMGGYIDTLVAAETAGQFSFVFNHTREQDKKDADMMSAAAARETAPDRGNWDAAIQDARFLGSLSGRGFLKPVFASIPRFKADLLVADHYDMVTELAGGSNLDTHLYKFQMNIFRDLDELKSAAADGFYDDEQVRTLFARSVNQEYKKEVADQFGYKAARLTGFGINMQTDAYVGTSLFNLTEGVIFFRGQWLYLLFDPKLKTWVRAEELVKVCPWAEQFPGRGPWATFATHRNPFTFWSKAPADDIYPVAYTMKKIVNLTVDNLEKRNWNMRAYDPKIFRTPSQLLWKRDGLVRATLKEGQDISKGIFTFETPDTTNITINLAQWLDNFLGQKTGITADAQGASKEDKVGILVSNIEQVSKRLGLSNRTFSEALVSIGVMLDYGFYTFLRGPMAVKILGPKGAQWEEQITRDTTQKEFSITVSDGAEDAQKTAQDVERKSAGLDRISKDKNLAAAVNPRWRAREELKMMGYDEEDARLALDLNNEADAEVLSKAAQAIQDCLEGKLLYKMHRDATTGFVQKILSFIDDNYDLVPPEMMAKMTPSDRKKYRADMAEYDKLLAYAIAHIPIAQENAVRAATSVLASRGAMGPGAEPLPPSSPTGGNIVAQPNTPASGPTAPLETV